MQQHLLALLIMLLCIIKYYSLVLNKNFNLYRLIVESFYLIFNSCMTFKSIFILKIAVIITAHCFLFRYN